VCACHVYLTYPFVLSWSLLEAMACGAVVIGSDTPPVAEVISNGVNGLLVDFFSPEALAERVAAVLADPAAHRALALEARRTVQQHFDLHGVCLPRQLALVDWLASGGPARGTFSPQGAGADGGANALAPYPALFSGMGTASLGSS
jgi:glycosyltransferase involved in cell wall biosynthesis